MVVCALRQDLGASAMLIYLGQKFWAGQAMHASIEKPQVEKHQSIESWAADIK
jgi:hypothetical protein